MPWQSYAMRNVQLYGIQHHANHWLSLDITASTAHECRWGALNAAAGRNKLHASPSHLVSTVGVSFVARRAGAVGAQYSGTTHPRDRGPA